VKRLSLALLTAIAVGGAGATSVSAAQLSSTQGNIANLPSQQVAQAGPAMSTPAMDFGSAPSGEVPILFNDHHVYTKPDTLRQGRVLAALVRGNEILVPLRSMFEQMGATVAYDPSTQTADVSKPGSDVKVTVGKAEVVINGESRPLDVPPMIYNGTIVVPVRVISEGMGAYVEWVPDKRVVVVRYVAAPVPTPPPAPTPPPTAPPTMAPPPATPPPTPAPTPAPKAYDDKFVVGDYIVSPVTYNQFSPGNAKLGPAYAGRAGLEFGLSSSFKIMVEADSRQYAYPHIGDYDSVIPRNTPCSAAFNPGAYNRGCVTTIGGQSNVYVPSFTALDRDLDVRLGLQILKPRIYLAGSYLWLGNNYGGPNMGGAGFGLEKLPDLDQPFSVFASYYYYPTVQGNFGDASLNTTFQEQYSVQKYEAGIDYNTPFGLTKDAGVFLEAGFMGDYGRNKQFAPSNFQHAGAFGGIGIHF
jgi:hypothetical protein